MTGKSEPKEEKNKKEVGGSELFKETFDEVISLDQVWRGWKLGRLILNGEDVNLLKDSGLAKFDEQDYIIELSAKSMIPESYRNYNEETDEETSQKIKGLAHRIEIKMNPEDGDGDGINDRQSYKLYKKLEGDVF